MFSNQNFNITQNLVNYIFSSIDLSKFKYEIIEYESELSLLTDTKYYLSANFSGSNCLLVFTKLSNKYHSFLIDRKTLSYNINKVDLNNVKLINATLKLDLDIYNGSIFDGIFIQNKNEKTFIITDVYLFKGQNYSKISINDKMTSIVAYLKSCYNQSDLNNNINLTVNKLYPVSDIHNLYNNVIPKIKNYSVRGLCFYPEFSGTKLVFIFGNEAKQETQILLPQNQSKHNYSPKQNLHVNSDHSENIVVSKTIMKTFKPKKDMKDIDYVFEMMKTENTDVYLLNVVEPVDKNGKKRLKRVKIGLAYIPNIIRSNWCNEIMAGSENNVLVNCRYHPTKLSWEPISKTDKTKPSLINDFDI